MFHRWAALVLVLALCAMSPKNAAGQTQSSQPRSTSGGIGHNYPNPFNPRTRIPFTVGDTTNGCANDRQLHVVTMQIRNVLSQLTAVPVMLGPSTAVTSAAPASMSGQPISEIKLECGEYTAYWSGNVLDTEREAPSGTYFVLLSIDHGKPFSSRIYNRK